MSAWHPYTAETPCPVCGRPEGCSYHHGLRIVRCQAVAVGCHYAYQVHSGPGYYHRAEAPWTGLYRESGCPEWQGPLYSYERLATLCRHAAQQAWSMRPNDELAKAYGVPDQALKRMGCGYMDHAQLHAFSTPHLGAGAWTFPLVRGGGATNGVMLVSGSGLVSGLAGSEWTGLLVDHEGKESKQPRVVIALNPLAVPALWSLGIPAIGVCGLRESQHHLVEWCRKHYVRSLVVFLERDLPGLTKIRLWRDYEAFQQIARESNINVDYIVPPEGIRDALAWFRAGATKQDIYSKLHRTPERRSA